MNFTIDKAAQMTIAVQLMTKQLGESINQTGQRLSAVLNNISQLAPLLDTLQRSKIAISDLTVQEPSLDDVFMNLTVGKN